MRNGKEKKNRMGKKVSLQKREIDVYFGRKNSSRDGRAFEGKEKFGSILMEIIL